MREAAIDFLVGISIGLAILFSFGAMMLVFDTFTRGKNTYIAPQLSHPSLPSGK